MRRNKGSDDPEATQIVPSRRLEAVGREPEATGNRAEHPPEPEPDLPARRRLKVVIYSVAVALVCTAGLVLLISYAWYLQPGQALDALAERLQRYALANTLFTMMIAGAAGGALSNLLEFLRLGRRRTGLPERLEVPLYLRPLSGGLMGVAVFFVLQFFVAVLSVGATTQGWALLHGRLAYVAVAFVVGFTVRDLEKARDIAASLLRRG
jgi:ABC-type Fe3+ transport system permease subunit